MDRDKLLNEWFGKDVSGWKNPQSYYKRINPQSITGGSMHDDWLIVMDTLVPNWVNDKSLHNIRSVYLGDYDDNQMCICGKQHLIDICIYTHPTLLGKGLQIGNVCVDKIDNYLSKLASNKLRKLKKEKKEIEAFKKRQEAEKKAEEDRKEELKKTHRQCCDCKEYKISVNVETWRIRCLPCWKNEKMKIKK